MSTALKPHKKLVTKSLKIDVDDLLLEIFLRLPLYSIQRFKTTCKNWQSLITNPTFRKQWRNQNIKPSTGLILRKKSPVSISLLPFSPNKPFTFKTKFKTKQSCNGLLLCLHKKKYHVYNPTTDTCHTLPELGHDVIVHGSTRVRAMNLVFDPNRFGSHYKVICIVCRYRTYAEQVHVYSSDNRIWELVSHKGGFTCSVNDKGVYWNGCIHWMLGLTYFDIENETFNKMPSPPAGSHWRTNYYLGESCDRLNFTKLWKTKEGASLSVDVYELKRDYSKWVLKYSVGLNNMTFVTSVVSVVHGVEEDDSFLVLNIGDGVMRYNLVSETVEELPVLWTGGFVDTAFQYFESLCAV